MPAAPKNDAFPPVNGGFEPVATLVQSRTRGRCPFAGWALKR